MLITRKLYLQDQVRFDDGLWNTSGERTVILPQGTYELCLHGAGGAGGENGASTGGAGGVGKRKNFTVKLSEPTNMTFSVGAKGLTKSGGGNGGAGGYTSAESNSGGGAGGGGGMPTWVKFNKDVLVKTYNAWVGTDGTLLYTLPDANTNEGSSVRVYTENEINGGVGFGLIVNITTTDKSFVVENIEYTKTSSLDLYSVLQGCLHALGGGGGGGGGGAGRQARYSDGGAGGGGGGYYRFDQTTGETISVDGKQGGRGGKATS